MSNKIQYQSMYEKATFIQPYLHYYLSFGICPNRLGIEGVDKSKLYKALIEKYKVSEDKIIKYQTYDSAKNETEHDYILFDIGYQCYVFYNQTWGCHRYDKVVEIIYSHQTSNELVKEVDAFIKTFIKKEENTKAEINLICRYDGGGLGLNSFEIIRSELDIEKNYNDDFIAIDKLISERLSKPKDKGIVLLHGIPGTGKTNYIRHLLTTVKKQMIYLPPDLATEIGSPGFISFLTDNPDSVLIIEDAENVIMERAGGSNGAISNLLNLCDGLLSDCLNIQVVCSFNTDISRIDKALMRKGRMIARYEFTKLSKDKAQRLSDSLGFTSVISKEMSLSEIYNQDKMDFMQQEASPIGFGRRVSA